MIRRLADLTGKQKDDSSGEIRERMWRRGSESGGSRPVFNTRLRDFPSKHKQLAHYSNEQLPTPLLKLSLTDSRARFACADSRAAFSPRRVQFFGVTDGRRSWFLPIYAVLELHRGLPNMHPGMHMRIPAEIPNHRRPLNLPDIPNPIAPQILVLVESHVQVIEAVFLD